MSFFSQNHTEINSDDWTITKKTTRTIKHENFSKMKNLKVHRWALSLRTQKTTPSNLTHWGRVTHICVSKLTIIGSDNGLSPDRRQAIIWTNAGIFLIGPSGTNFSEILIEILTFSFKKMRLNVSSAKWRPFCLGLNVLIIFIYSVNITYIELIFYHEEVVQVEHW